MNEYLEIFFSKRLNLSGRPICSNKTHNFCRRVAVNTRVGIKRTMSTFSFFTFQNDLDVKLEAAKNSKNPIQRTCKRKDLEKLEKQRFVVVAFIFRNIL